MGNEEYSEGIRIPFTNISIFSYGQPKHHPKCPDCTEEYDSHTLTKILRNTPQRMAFEAQTEDGDLVYKCEDCNSRYIEFDPNRKRLVKIEIQK